MDIFESERIRTQGGTKHITEREKESKNRLKERDMKKTTSSRKERKERDILALNISLALSKFTAIMMGEPDKYKTTNRDINYYPSDCLNYWRYSTIDKDGQIVNDPTKRPEDVAGIACKGIRYWNDKPQELTVMFKDI